MELSDIIIKARDMDHFKLCVRIKDNKKEKKAYSSWVGDPLLLNESVSYYCIMSVCLVHAQTVSCDHLFVIINWEPRG